MTSPRRSLVSNRRVLDPNPPPFPLEPTHRRVRDGVVMAGAFAVGVGLGVVVVVNAVGRDLFDRFQSVTRR